MKHTKFQLAVWQACLKIPRGRISTYAALARSVGTVNAARAVGNALNKNPHSPKVPCHRVVKSNGKVGGFAHGAKKKIKMLEKEGIKIKNDKLANFRSLFFEPL